MIKRNWWHSLNQKHIIFLIYHYLEAALFWDVSASFWFFILIINRESHGVVFVSTMRRDYKIKFTDKLKAYLWIHLDLAKTHRLKGLTQCSNFSSKAVGKTITEAEANKILFASVVPRQFFSWHNPTNLCICLGNSLGSLRKLLRQCCFI